MKKLTWLLFTFFTLVFLSACGQHATFQGKWKAQKANGENIDIVFNDKTGKLGNKEFHYKIDDSGYQDNTKYYSITVSETYHYTILFPDDDMKIATLIEPEDPSSDPLYGEMLYAMNRDAYPDFDDYVDKYLYQD
ncbi:hypothetical protein [Streptococcus sanguinis]|jgi:hypothetical protein|uniref:Glycosyltransferase n=1 Tax=Streptococcus sanguinis TaxID=1305 RepID=A0AAJ5NGV5_STRSA|nr:hypothetical protein [Streptococcus sanguinis]MCY7017414.1 hypothetical protein [Streptococcus sanguinis]RSI53868.1 hypothetical protein D8870_06255 [Streptococcus sanguinis]VDY70845.1 glycosyltransferase [Streptococcus sanguinis]